MKRLAMLADFPEEQWPSMDLVAEQLFDRLTAEHADRFATSRVCATYRPLLKGRGRNIDRLFNRFVTYPRYAKSIRSQFDLFHLCDHSYSQVIHSLPADRVGVFCHDLDTFKCLLEPAKEPRPRWFRAMVKRILTGMQKARLVFHTTDDVRRQILRHGLIDESRLVQAPYGMSAEFRPMPLDPAELLAVRPPAEPFLLHVGSCIPRKRVDVLLDVFTVVRRDHPQMKLCQIGGEWTTAQREQIDRLRIADGLLTYGRQPRPVVAEFYRRAAMVLMPSEAEGFGLPVAEAMACGAIVLASDIPVLREVGADAAVYAPLADIPAWAGQIARLLVDASTAPAVQRRLARAADFSWSRHASTIADAYAKL